MAVPEKANFDEATDVREFPHGRVEVVEVAGGEVARLTLMPGWKWSEHVKPKVGTDLCQGAHFQYVISGRVMVEMADGTQIEIGPGDVNMLPAGHDAWVLGDEDCVVVDWGGLDAWSKLAA